MAYIDGFALANDQDWMNRVGFCAEVSVISDAQILAAVQAAAPAGG